MNNGTIYTLKDIVGESVALTKAIDKARKAAITFPNILIYGETGTGKEIVAQGIHNASARRNEPFVAVNCSAIPETLLESIFFGTAKGAFTGATDSPGIFEAAGRGTVLLDEINSMPLSLQSKLLRVLQERTVTRLGSSGVIPFECSIISTTNREPMECIRDRSIREDLFYRISVIGIELPPLRERDDDVTLLAEKFIHDYECVILRSRMISKNITMSEEFRNCLKSYRWPGNVRELQHIIEGTISTMDVDETELTVDMLPKRFRKLTAGASEVSAANLSGDIDVNGDLKGVLERFERDVILATMKRNNNNISKTARDIGYTRSNLQFKLQKYRNDN